MVRDGFYYGVGAAIAAVLLALVSPWLAFPPLLLGAFFLWFFRDPERTIPGGAGLIVSPADGKVTAISRFSDDGRNKQRISIFLNVFDVHVNRSPIAGTITALFYQKGKFGNAMSAGSSDANEQNIVTMQGDGETVVFKQIAGLLARRIIFTARTGDKLQRGQRIGLIKFGSRVDVVLDDAVDLQVKVGDRVSGGSSILGVLRTSATQARAEVMR
ncbi:MAG: phosphatidylserine decarboxylase [Acidobacteria bacterium 13_1_20CM_4_56_7]|jgi:phosphatidylserine decarboxylase|nr:MAG: phosphatidylserine decarboxylase [Acidobacteria bacterium 13_1_20CM_4_56_7]HJW99588.1 phosphatidylserine decarboxylase [Terriglobales bacterium]